MSDTASHFKNRVIKMLEGALRVEHRFAVTNSPWSNKQDFMEPSTKIVAVNVFEDNEGIVKLAVNKHASRSTKHINVKFFLLLIHTFSVLSLQLKKLR